MTRSGGRWVTETRKRIYIPYSAASRRQYWRDEQLERLQHSFDVTLAGAEGGWSAVPAGVHGFLCGWGASALPAAVWQAQEALEAVAIFGGSPQAVEDVAGLLERGVCITNASDEMAEGVAEATVALLLAGQLDVVNSATRFRRAFDASYSPRLSRSLCGSTIGMIGFGFVGRHVARMLQGFGANLLVSDPYVDVAQVEAAGCRVVSLEELLRRSDVVTLHAGLTAETEGFITGPLLDLLREQALVVSTARTSIFDERALAERVARGRLRFASDFIPLDAEVWEPLHGCEHLIGVHGHTSVTTRTVLRMTDRVIADLEAILNGEGAVGHRVLPQWIDRTT